MVSLQVNRDSGVPINTQLAWQLRSMIERGELQPGDQLPSLRVAAAAAGVNLGTIRAVYSKLEAAGVVKSEQGKGTFVTPEPIEDEAVLRRGLREEIARLENELVHLPLLPPDAAKSGSSGPRMLSVDELETVRDLLAERVRDLQATRTEIAQRLEAQRRAPAPKLEGSIPESAPAVPRARWKPA